MSKWHNEIGKPLSSLEWLEVHHNAKLLERENFVKKVLLKNKPKKIIDLGCASGLWLDVFNKFLPNECEFVGIDIDCKSINEAKKRSKKWNRKISFINIDISKDTSKIPDGDMFLAFNMFSYIDNADYFIDIIKSKLNPNGMLVVRQYDGATIRFGPMSSENRNYMDDSIFNALGDSKQFRHFDLDRVYKSINNSVFTNKEIYFETFQKHSPFTKEFDAYFKGTVEWTNNYLNNIEAQSLEEWYTKYNNQIGYYFLENYLVSLLSCGTSANSHKSK